jgi:DNA-binding SARP family transcriptional activator
MKADAHAAGLIHSKVTMPALEEFVDRPRLHDRLAELIAAHRVVVVSATAGSGKTVAVASAAQRASAYVAWLSVARTDVAAGRLLSYLEAALARCCPAVAGVATGALAAGVPHAEAAGLLAEAVERDVVMVLDDLERLEDAAAAWAVLEALIRYAPPSLKVVLVSRRDVPVNLCSLPLARTATLGEADLAFTPGEAADALASVGKRDVDPVAAVEATGGWVTGVLFEAWRSSGAAAALGGEADPLNGYLAAHIMAQLDPALCDFLIATSLFDEVTASRAESLGLERAGERLLALRAAHLPVRWEHDGRTMRCHSRFREYLLERLTRRGGRELRELRRAYARSLAADGHDEDATEEFIRAGLPEDAVATAKRAIMPVIERLDIGIAERWIEALADCSQPEPSILTEAEMMVAIAQDDIRRCVRIADQLKALGSRDDFARRSERSAALMAWAYFHAGRADDVRAVLAAAEPGPIIDATRYGLQALSDDPYDPAAASPPPPELTGSLLDLLVYATDYCLGRLRDLTEAPPSRWMDAMMGPWRVGALRASGRTDRALALYEEARASGTMPPVLRIFIGPEIQIDLGRREEAREALAEGRRVAHATGSLGLQALNALADAKASLRLERDTARARAVLGTLEMQRAGDAFPFYREMRDTWLGLADLLDGESAAALERLRSAVDSMVLRNRTLELPTAAAYLAEAEWRAGEEERADRAADLALDAAAQQGSNHLLLQALSDVPRVVSRRLDAVPESDSVWHGLARSLLAQRVDVPWALREAAELHEFGRRALIVDGQEVRPRIAKTYELLSLLVTRGAAGIERGDLLDALFEGRSDASARSYLRTTIQWLRHCLPDGAVLTDTGRVRISESVSVVAESMLFEAQLGAAARLQGSERKAATIAALGIYDRGEYLPGPHGSWADDRAQSLAAMAADARCEAAELALAEGAYDEAQELVEQVLRAEPYSEPAWRTAMRLAETRGDQQGVVRAYRSCEHALAEMNARPSATTQRLLETLRR